MIAFINGSKGERMNFWDGECVVGKAFLLQHLKHRAQGVVEAPDIGVVTGQFPAQFRQVFEKARHFSDFLRLDPTTGRLASGEVVGAFDADERAVRVVAVDIVEVGYWRNLDNLELTAGTIPARGSLLGS